MGRGAGTGTRIGPIRPQASFRRSEGGDVTSAITYIILGGVLCVAHCWVSQERGPWGWPLPSGVRPWTFAVQRMAGLREAAELPTAAAKPQTGMPSQAQLSEHMSSCERYKAGQRIAQNSF